MGEIIRMFDAVITAIAAITSVAVKALKAKKIMSSASTSKELAPEKSKELEKSEELEPCPFCDSEDINVGKFGAYPYTEYQVYCENCENGTAKFDSEEEAIAAWNKRAKRAKGYHHAQKT